jgi:hypothetical protein
MMGDTNLQNMSQSGLKVILNQLVNNIEFSDLEDNFDYYFRSGSDKDQQITSMVESMTGQKMSREDREFLFELLQSFMNTGEIVIPEKKSYYVFMSEDQVVNQEVIYRTEVESFLTESVLRQSVYEYISNGELDLFDSSNLFRENILETEYNDYHIVKVTEI